MSSIAFLLLAGMSAPVLAQGAAEEPAQYAIVVNGDDSFTHNLNVELALSSLAKLGYRQANTFLLSANPRQQVGLATIRPATRRSLADTIALLQARMHHADLLLIYLTGHGVRFFGHAVLELASGAVGATALAREVSALPFDKLILIADQCYSGAFVKAFVAIGRNVVAVSSVDDTHEVRCEPFVRPFWSAAVDAEHGRDAKGYVSIEEAFLAGEESLAAGAGRQTSVSAQYAATGTCKGRENRFSAGPSRPASAAAHAAPRTVQNPGGRR